MKSLLESIFGSRESIIDISKKSLWIGYEESFLDKKKYILTKNGYFHIKWAAGKGSILQYIYPQFKNPILSCAYIEDDPYIYFTLSENISNNKKTQFINIFIGGFQDFADIKDKIYNIARSFRKYPEIFNDYPDTYTHIQWKEFENKYIKK